MQHFMNIGVAVQTIGLAALWTLKGQVPGCKIVPTSGAPLRLWGLEGKV